MVRMCRLEVEVSFKHFHHLNAEGVVHSSIVLVEVDRRLLQGEANVLPLDRAYHLSLADVCVDFQSYAVDPPEGQALMDTVFDDVDAPPIALLNQLNPWRAHEFMVASDLVSLHHDGRAARCLTQGLREIEAQQRGGDVALPCLLVVGIDPSMVKREETHTSESRISPNDRATHG